MSTEFDQQYKTSKQTLIDKWLYQMDEDKLIDELRAQKTSKRKSFINQQHKGIKIDELNEKLNRLERNFLRETDIKKEQKSVDTVNQCYHELDQIYKNASKILASLKETQKHDGKQLASQIVSLYNRSVAELSKRQKLEKEIKNKKARRDQLTETKTMFLQDQNNLENQHTIIEAQHWLKVYGLQRKHDK